MELAVLIDNQAEANRKAQHGLSLWLDTGRQRILIDTGQDGLFLNNAASMGVPIESITHLVLTHGHYDHTGGVPALTTHNLSPTVLVHKQAWKPRCSLASVPPRSIGIPWTTLLLEQADWHLQTVMKPTQIAPRIWLTGTIPNHHGLPDTPHLRCQVDQEWEIDEFDDEQALVLITTEGLLVITGCCHRGVLNTLDAAKAITGETRVYGLIGGLHLNQTTGHACVSLANALRQYGLKHLWINHCTGPSAFEVLRDKLGPQVAWAKAGQRIQLPDLAQ